MREVQEAPCPRQGGRVMRAPRLCAASSGPALRLRRRGSAAPRRPPALSVFDISSLVPDMKAANLVSVSGAALVNIASSAGGTEASRSRGPRPAAPSGQRRVRRRGVTEGGRAGFSCP